MIISNLMIYDNMVLSICDVIILWYNASSDFANGIVTLWYLDVVWSLSMLARPRPPWQCPIGNARSPQTSESCLTGGRWWDQSRWSRADTHWQQQTVHLALARSGATNCSPPRLARDRNMVLHRDSENPSMAKGAWRFKFTLPGAWRGGLGGAAQGLHQGRPCRSAHQGRLRRKLVAAIPLPAAATDAGGPTGPRGCGGTAGPAAARLHEDCIFLERRSAKAGEGTVPVGRTPTGRLAPSPWESAGLRHCADGADAGWSAGSCSFKVSLAPSYVYCLWRIRYIVFTPSGNKSFAVTECGWISVANLEMSLHRSVRSKWRSSSETFVQIFDIKYARILEI